MNNYKWSLEDIEGMMFWEREIYVNLLVEEKRKDQENAIQRQLGK